MCKDCNWEAAWDMADGMLDDEEGRWDWAESVLTGIRDWVVDNEHVTDKQRTALKNIKRGVTNAKRTDKGRGRQRTA